LGNSLISWKAKKQSTVSRSSSESEYRALASTTCEIQWLDNLLRYLKIDYITPAYIAHNAVFHKRTKHIEIDCHVVREKLQNGLFKLLRIKSNHQLVDIFTKPLEPTPFECMLSKLGILNIYSLACGGIGEIICYFWCFSVLGLRAPFFRFGPACPSFPFGPARPFLFLAH
jgi:hypothetical protein